MASTSANLPSPFSHLSSTSHDAATPPSTSGPSPARSRADKYRGATLLDLDPPPALSVSPQTAISSALLSAYERDYTHLTVVSAATRALLGYFSIPHLRALLKAGTVSESDPVEVAMMKFRRGRKYRLITMDTGLDELEGFFEGDEGEKQDFAVVTDAGRRFVLGVATRWDLDEFVRRRPA